MKELKTIIAAYHNIDFSQRKAALATVVKVKGSSYRSPGARMLITDDGKWVGSISGGCLEGDALRKARQVMNTKIPVLVTYDTREESNQKLGISLGCNGVIDILIEPVEVNDPNNAIHLFTEIIDTGYSKALATIITSTQWTGQKMMIDETGLTIVDFENEELSQCVSKDLKGIFSTRKSGTKYHSVNSEEVEIFIELIQPGISLILFGGGFDARPVSELAKSLGWHVTVTDECVAHIAPLFFPSADKLSLCHRDWVDRDINISGYTACILMSHNYEYDRDVLRKLINTPSPYIGILGPRKRFDKMMEELKSENVNLSDAILSRIHSPIGLDIGAETPDEIALSIISEIQAKFSNRSGGFLKYRSGPIHQRDLKTNEINKQMFLGGHNAESNLA